MPPSALHELVEMHAPAWPLKLQSPPVQHWMSAGPGQWPAVLKPPSSLHPAVSMQKPLRPWALQLVGVQH
jgi:hypothetical protein